MAHGIAVVGSAGGAIPETLGDAGLVVPEEDVGALAEALQRLHDNRRKSGGSGAAGRRRVMESYTDAAIAQRTLAFWHDLLRATA